MLELCAGIGGLGLGLSIAIPGARTVCFVENEATAAEKLVARMEDASIHPAPIWSDLKTFDGRAWRGVVDIVVAGYPCQPFSCAGKQRGEADPRHLWPHVARIIDESRPGRVFLENVDAHLRIGYEQVRRDLQQLGYTVTQGIFTAEEIGAPHLRKRLFVLAHRNSQHGDLLRRERPGLSMLTRRGAELADASSERRQQEPRGASRDEKTIARRARRRQPEGDHQPNCISEVAELADARHEQTRRPNGSSDTESARARGTTSGRGNEMEYPGLGLVPLARRRPEERAGTRPAGANVADAAGGQREQLRRTVAPARDGRRQRVQGSFSFGRVFPPGPNDLDGWREVDASLKPAVCRMAHGTTPRVDRLRATGNGVVPLVAAYAYRSLERTFESRRGSIKQAA